MFLDTVDLLPFHLLFDSKYTPGFLTLLDMPSLTNVTSTPRPHSRLL
jgi:hypothetical protein